MSLHLVISNKEDSSVLFIIYNSQILSDQQLLWRSLSGLSSILLPWLLTGDFNALLLDLEHKEGNSISYSSKSSFFNSFVNSNLLLDLGFISSRFTWCNGQTGLARRWARLDQFLANHYWVNTYSSLKNLHLPRNSSDHSPIFLTSRTGPLPRNHTFRFDNIWLEYNACHDNILRAFNSNTSTTPMHAFHHCIYRAKHNLITWKVLLYTLLTKKSVVWKLKSKMLKRKTLYPLIRGTISGLDLFIPTMLPCYVKTHFFGAQCARI